MKKSQEKGGKSLRRGGKKKMALYQDWEQEDGFIQKKAPKKKILQETIILSPIRRKGGGPHQGKKPNTRKNVVRTHYQRGKEKAGGQAPEGERGQCRGCHLRIFLNKPWGEQKKKKTTNKKGDSITKTS